MPIKVLENRNKIISQATEHRRHGRWDEIWDERGEKREDPPHVVPSLKISKNVQHQLNPRDSMLPRLTITEEVHNK